MTLPRRSPLALLPFLLIFPALPAASAPEDSPATVSVAGVPVPRDGTPDAIRALLSKKLGSRLDRPITLTDGTKTISRTRAELGVGLDLDRMVRGVAAGQKFVPLLFVTDPAAAKRALGRVADTFAAPATSARPVVQDGQVRIRPSVFSRALDVPATAARLVGMIAGDPTLHRLQVTLVKKSPAVTSEQLAGINGIVASFATTAANHPNRNHNIAIAVEAINDTVLAPGETFSLNQTVGERTKKRGFRSAPVFVDAKKVEGIGGGVSQVTGTLFNAAALADMKIDEVHPHSRPVAYLPLGRDATVAWEQKDLRFTNATKSPVYIRYTFEDQRLRAVFFGKKVEGRTVTLKPSVRRQGPGRIRAALYRMIRQDGHLTRKERLFRHTYEWTPETEKTAKT